MRIHAVVLAAGLILAACTLPGRGIETVDPLAALTPPGVETPTLAAPGLAAQPQAATNPASPLQESPAPEPLSTAQPPATPRVETPAFDKWQLWSGGTQLRGVNIYQRQVFPEMDGTDFLGPGPFGPPYTQADFDHLAQLGANYVNISHPGLYTVEPPYRIDQAAVDNLDHLLALVSAADMFAVITLRSGPGRSEFSILREGAGDWFDQSYLIETVWSEPAAQAAWADMWRFAAGHYRDNPVVVGYDLMCEPNANEILDMWDAADFYARQDSRARRGYDWNTWYPAIVTAIREVDQATPILISAMSYGDLDWLPYLRAVDDARTVYTFHQYSPHSYTHQDAAANPAYEYPDELDTDDDGQVEPFDRAWLEARLAQAQGPAVAPVRRLAVNEYGVVRWAPDAAAYLRDEMTLFEQHGWNYAIWMWYPAWEPMLEGDNSFNLRLGADPNQLQEAGTTGILDVLGEFWVRNTWRPSRQ